MIKSFSFVLACIMALCVANTSFAQYNKIDYTASNGNLKLVQLDVRDDVTVMYFTYVSSGNDSLAIGGDIEVKSKGSYRTISLKKYANITSVKDNAARIRFKNAGEKLNFALIFSKFPVAKEFSIIETPVSSLPPMLNVKNIQIDTSSRVDLIDAEKFFAEAPMSATGTKIINGAVAQVVSDKGLSIMVTNSYIAQFGRYQRFFFDIENKTGRSVEFRESGVGITAVYKDGKVRAMTPVPISEIKGRVTGQEVVGGILFAGAMVSTVYTITAISTPGMNLTTDNWANNFSKTMFALDGAAQANFAKHPEKFKKMLEEFYIKDSMIKDNGTFGCFFNVREDKSIKQIIIKLMINGDVYDFSFDLKHTF